MKDCKVLVKKVLKGVLHLHDAKNILFDRTHRVGQKIGIRPVVWISERKIDYGLCFHSSFYYLKSA